MEKKKFIDVLRERVVSVEKELRLLKEALAVYEDTEPPPLGDDPPHPQPEQR